jgi:hypothetical protein
MFTFYREKKIYKIIEKNLFLNNIILKLNKFTFIKKRISNIEI